MDWQCFETRWTFAWTYWMQNEMQTNKREEKNSNATRMIWQMNDGGYVALKRAAEDRGIWRLKTKRKDVKKPAVHYFTAARFRLDVRETKPLAQLRTAQRVSVFDSYTGAVLVCLAIDHRFAVSSRYLLGRPASPIPVPVLLWGRPVDCAGHHKP